MAMILLLIGLIFALIAFARLIDLIIHLIFRRSSGKQSRDEAVVHVQISKVSSDKSDTKTDSQK